MKHLVHLTTVLSITAIAIVAVACSPASTATPSPTAIPPTDIPPPTDTPPPTATPPPTNTPTPEPTPTETSTPTPIPTPTVVKKAVEICIELQDGKPAKGAYLAIMDANYAQIIPDDGTTGIQVTSNNGCRTVKLSPGSYHAIAQKVMSVSEYVSGQADFDVALEGSTQVAIILTGN